MNFHVGAQRLTRSWRNQQILARQKQKNLEIEASIEADARKQRVEIDVLLLGANQGERFQILNQLILESGQFTNHRIDDYIPVIFSYILTSLYELAHELGVNEHLMQAIDWKLSVSTGQQFPIGYLQPLKDIWGRISSSISSSWVTNSLHNESLFYFLNNLDRIFSANYKPNFQDIIHLMPKAQSGISTTNLASGRLSYRFLNCNDQPSKRKWLHQFENILCLVYVVKLDEYDEFDDEGLNRFRIETELFNSICNSPWLKDVSVAIILVNKDAFLSKLRIRPLNHYFPEFVGRITDPEAALKFLIGKFELPPLEQEHKRLLFTHVVSATYVNVWSFLNVAFKEIILHNALQSCGLSS